MPSSLLKQQHARYVDVRRQIWNGDHLLFRRPDSLIARYGGDGPYSHAGVAVWRTSAVGSTLCCSHSLEWSGARTDTLSSQVQLRPGAIDVYRPLCSDICREWIAELAFRHSGHRYNTRGVIAGTLRRMMAVRFLIRQFRRWWPWLPCLDHDCDARLDGDEQRPWSRPKFCSEQVIWCDREAARICGEYFDPVANTPDDRVMPNDFSHGNRHLVYLFTLWDLEIPQRAAAGDDDSIEGIERDVALRNWWKGMATA